MIKLYRYHATRSYNSSGDGEPELLLEEFIAIKETPCGYWCIPKPFFGSSNDPQDHHDKRWVSKSARKRYCYPTISEALQSFIIRSSRRLGYLRNDLEMVEGALNIARGNSAATVTMNTTRL